MAKRGRPQIYSEEDLCLIVLDMKKETGKWPTQDAVKTRGHCNTERAKRALEAAKEQEERAGSQATRQFNALALLVVFPNQAAAEDSLAELSLWEQRTAGNIAPTTKRFSAEELRALLALQGIDTAPNESAESLQQRLQRLTQQIWSDQSAAIQREARARRNEAFVHAVKHHYYTRKEAEKANALLDQIEEIQSEVQEERDYLASGYD